MIRAAISGYGWWGQHIARRLAAHDAYDLAGVFAPELAGSHTDQGHRIYASFQDVLDDPSVDAVILTCPNDQHEPQAVRAAQAGKHVFCEKPLALDAGSARRIVDAANDAGRVLGIGHERRFEPAMQRLAQMLRDGELGTIMHVEAAFSHDKLAGLPKDNWRTQPDLAPAAGMTGMGIHLTDFMIWMLGPVVSVQAQTTDRSLGWATGDVLVAQLRFRAGMTASLSAILHTPHFMRFHVFGSQQWAEVRNDTHPDTPGGQAHLVTSRSNAGLSTESFDWTDSVVDNLAAFADAIEGHAAYPFTAAQMVHNIEVLDAIAASAKSGETVRL